MKRPADHHTDHGFTLIEMLLYVAIASLLLFSITYFFGGTVDSRVKNQTINEVDQQGTYMMDYITQTIRNATSISLPAAGATSNSLTLVVPTGSLSPTVFSLSGSTVQVKEGAGAAVSLSSSSISVSSLSFTNLTRPSTNGLVRVSITMNRVNTLSRNEYDYQRTFVESAEVRW